MESGEDVIDALDSAFDEDVDDEEDEGDDLMRDASQIFTDPSRLEETKSDPAELKVRSLMISV